MAGRGGNSNKPGDGSRGRRRACVPSLSTIGVTMAAITAPPTADLRGGLPQVLIATLASTVGFWAWMMIAPLQGIYASEMGLDQVQISIMLATPVLVGALGRIVVGAYADRFGGPKMFTFVLLAAVPAVL